MDLLRTRIDLDAIAYNTRILKQLAAPAKLMAVVKADAYNHGVAEVAPVIAAHGADAFGVASISEALELRQLGISLPILCWIWSPEQDFLEAIAQGIDLAVISPSHARALIDAPTDRIISVAVKVDTGLHRSGVDEADWDEVFSALHCAEHINVTGLFSHFACADEPQNPENDLQSARFRDAIDRARKAGLEVPENHLCNSPAALSRPEEHFDMIRPGAALYGLETISGHEFGLRPAMSWIGSITVVKPIAEGESVSYGQKWRASKSGWLAVVPAGYADGLPRAAENQVEVTINGHRYQQVGRVCMDQIVIDLGDNPHSVQPGDEAIIFGPGGVSATELGRRLGTINYEIVCRPTGRTVRTYVGKRNES